MANRFPIFGSNEADHSFILFGRTTQGLSSLANLIVGCRSGKEFPTNNVLAAPLTSGVKNGRTKILLKNQEDVIIDVFDQCGFNNGNVSMEVHKNNLCKCISNTITKMHTNYLIVINLSKSLYEFEQYNTLAAINEWLTNESYTFSDNAVIVFTHKDVLLEEYRIVCEDCYPQELIDKDLLCDDCSEDEPNLNTIRDCKKCGSTALTEGKLALRHHVGQQCQIKCDKCENGTDHQNRPCESCDDNKLYSILTSKRNTVEWHYINKTLELLPNFIIINALDMSERIPVLRELVDLTTPTLKILIHGNFEFSSKKIKIKIKKLTNPINYRRFNLEFYYHPDYQLHTPLQIQELIDKQLTNRMREDLKLVNSISVIMILINLTTAFGNAFNEFISCIRKDYEGFNTEEDWWKYVVLIFYLDGKKTSSDVNKIIDKNRELKALVKKVNNRYIIMKDETSKDEFLDSVLRESIKVKQINKGKDYIKRVVVEGMIVKLFDAAKKKNGNFSESKFCEYLKEAKQRL